MLISEVITLARDPLNDATGDRYTDAQLLQFCRQGLNEARRLRPDLFVGKFSVNLAALVAADALPIPDEFAQAIADFITGRAELRDDEHVNSGRAVALAKLFSQALTGR
jgi:hypothetical protein